MKYGDDVQDKCCARCHQPLVMPMVYRDSLWFHARCFNNGARQLRNAMRLAEESKSAIPPLPSSAPST
jgi:hypothetical protein